MIRELSLCFSLLYGDHLYLHVLTHSFPPRRSSDLAVQRQAVDFLVLRKLETGIADLDILHRARIVGGGGAAEQRVRGAFELALAVRGTTRCAADAIGDRRAAEQDHAAPQRLAVVGRGAFDVAAAGEEDRKRTRLKP